MINFNLLIHVEFIEGKLRKEFELTGTSFVVSFL